MDSDPAWAHETDSQYLAADVRKAVRNSQWATSAKESDFEKHDNRLNLVEIRGFVYNKHTNYEKYEITKQRKFISVKICSICVLHFIS